MSVRTALQLINQEVDAYLTALEGELDADTRFCITWFEQRGVAEGPFGEADVLARARGTSVEGLVQGGAVVARAGKVRLLRRDELPLNWDPRLDRRLSVWECTQHLIRALDRDGEDGAATIVAQLGGGQAEAARALAYRLFATCERKKWAEEALAYNSLVASWPAIQARAAGVSSAEQQEALL